MPKKRGQEPNQLYDRRGIFVNLNRDSDKPFVAALQGYMDDNCIKVSSAIKSLAMKQLIAEGRLKPQPRKI